MTLSSNQILRFTCDNTDRDKLISLVAILCRREVFYQSVIRIGVLNVGIVLRQTQGDWRCCNVLQR